MVERLPIEIVAFLTDCGLFRRRVPDAAAGVSTQAQTVREETAVVGLDEHTDANAELDGCGVEVSAAEAGRRARMRSGARPAGLERRKTEMIVETFTIKVFQQRVFPVGRCRHELRNKADAPSRAQLDFAGPADRECGPRRRALVQA